LHPNLGVVSVDIGQSFVIADIPGLIEGAAEGAGLGIQFLKHLSRTRLLLHIVDLASGKDAVQIIEDINTIVGELHKYNDSLGHQDRWLVLNKIDLISTEELAEFRQAIVKGLKWDRAIYEVSAINGLGCKQLMWDIYGWLQPQSGDDEELDEYV
jgi:GTP-binding protein